MNFEERRAYIITFKDHCLSSDQILMDCMVLGWVVSQDDERVTVTFWHVCQEEYWEDNIEPVNIIKSTIKDYRLLNI